VPDSFYEPDGELYVSTELTRGPWDPEAQHAGPPAALIGREVERLGGGRVGGEDGPPTQVGRITYEVLRSVPIAPLRVEARIVRPGRRVEMFEATLTDEAGEGLMRAQGWRLRTEPVDFEEPEPAPEPPPGPATVWMRMAVPLLPGEELSPLQRVLAAADSGNGVSAALDWSRYLFINVDLSVHLHRMSEGEWVCLDAVTLPERNGVGMADTRLLDERGPIGRAAQTLLVADRS
jgi:hypothetical protein